MRLRTESVEAQTLAVGAKAVVIAVFRTGCFVVLIDEILDVGAFYGGGIEFAIFFWVHDIDDLTFACAFVGLIVNDDTDTVIRNCELETRNVRIFGIGKASRV